ncbi:MAG TPA: hypothetical protein VF941_14470 [Clostridia bacterium]
MDFTDVLKFIELGEEDIFRAVESKMIAENPVYEESEEKFYKELESFDKKTSRTIENNVNNMLLITLNTYYSEGFRHGIRFIIEQLTGHKICFESAKAVILDTADKGGHYVNGSAEQTERE